MGINGAEIQVEDGNWSKLHNGIWEALCAAPLSGAEFRCLMFLFRQTYGWKKKQDTISMGQWAGATGLDRRSVIRTVQGLLAKNVIYRIDNGTTKPATWGFNKYVETWKLDITSDQNVTSDEIDTSTSDKTDTTASDQNVTHKRYRKISKELPESDEPTLPASSLADRFHALIDKLRDGNNKPATLREVYILCYGETGAPAFSYLGKAAREVGGAGYLAQRMFELVTRPPNGDVIAYILGEHRNKKNRANGYGKDAPTSNSSWIELETEIPEYMRT